MTRRLLASTSFALILFASGCATRTTESVSLNQSDNAALQTSATEALLTVGLDVRSTRIYVDVLPVMDLRDGAPIINTAHVAEAGRAAVAALQEAFASRGFRAAQGEFTSIGLGAPPRNILLTSGAETPVPASLPVFAAPGLSGTDRGAWVASLYASVHTFAAEGTAPATLAATYLSPNLNRIEVFAVLKAGDDTRAHIWVVAFDSRNGKVLWTGTAWEPASILDGAVATSLVRSLVSGLPVLARKGA
ncbi:MAG TPA: hypothetical protein VMM36_11560 [Opitutaceae bacterium]|nr:hypothetical protein [Opitutaceae bacterium]